MANLPVSLFVREPGKTRTLFLEGAHLFKAVKNLTRAEVLEIRKEDEKICLVNKKGELVGRVEEQELAAKILFALGSNAELEAIFVSLNQIGNSNSNLRAQFILKSSLPIFANEKKNDLKPFLRAGEIGSENKKNDDEKAHDETASPEEALTEEEANPLAGLSIIGEEKPTEADDESLA